MRPLVRLSLLVAAVLALSARPVRAIVTDPDNPPSLPCFDGWYGSLTASSNVVVMEQLVTLTWRTHNSRPGCSPPINHQLVTYRGGRVMSVQWVSLRRAARVTLSGDG